MDINTSNKVNLDMQAVSTVYRHYKANILPIGVILTCIGILLFIVVPQFNNYLKSKEELKVETQKLELLKNNYNFLLTLDDSQTSTDFKTLSKVLPPNKDFVGIMSAITLAASKTGVSVEDFKFSLGDLDKDVNASVHPSIRIDINIGGDVKNSISFIKELYKTVPASEVSSIKAAGSISTLAISFYYKPFPPKNISSESPIIPLSAKNKSFIESLSSWNSSDIGAFLPDVSASQSGGTNPSPF